jgi:hypothetical protein
MIDNTNCVKQTFEYGELISCERIHSDRTVWDLDILEDGIVVEYLPDCSWKSKVEELNDEAQ